MNSKKPDGTIKYSIDLDQGIMNIRFTYDKDRKHRHEYNYSFFCEQIANENIVEKFENWKDGIDNNVNKKLFR